MAESVVDLKSLYNVDAMFEYTGRNRLARAIRAFLDSTPDESSFLLDQTMLVTRFPPKMFEKDSEEIDNAPKGKSLYFPESQILIFTMPGGPHEILSHEIGRILDKKISNMNCLEEFVATQSTKRQLQNFSKEPDGSWGPDAADYCTCVLEIGMSESLRRLDFDARRWIEDEASRVTQVITVKIYPHRQEIIFATWRRIAPQQAEKDNEIHIELCEGRPIVRDNRRLHLSFEQIFERPPTRGSAERDVIFSARELGGMARKVWRHMGFIPRG